MSTGPISKKSLPFTKRGHCLDIEVWPFGLVVAVATEGLNTAKGERSPWILARFDLVTGNTRPFMQDFAEHALSFFKDDELLVQIRDYLRGFYDGLNQAAPIASQAKEAN